MNVWGSVAASVPSMAAEMIGDLLAVIGLIGGIGLAASLISAVLRMKG